MSQRKESQFNELFSLQLHALRDQIAALPDACRETLHSFADEVQEKHRLMQDGCANVARLVDDLAGNVKTAKSRFRVRNGHPEAHTAEGI